MRVKSEQPVPTTPITDKNKTGALAKEEHFDYEARAKQRLQLYLSAARFAVF